MRRLKGPLVILLSGLAYAPVAAVPAAPVLWLFMCAIDWSPMSWVGLFRVWSSLTVVFYGMFVLAAVGELWSPTAPRPSSAPEPASPAASE